MANRYWVGGTGNWDTSDTSHWSASSGGAAGASVPTSADPVFINASSGGGTITMIPNGSGQVICGGLDCTGAPATTFGGSPSYLNCYGSIKIVANITLNVNWNLSLYGTGTTTIEYNKLNQYSIYPIILIYTAQNIVFNAGGGFSGFQYQAAVVTTVDFNDYSFTVGSNGLQINSLSSVDFGNGTFTFNSYGGLTMQGTITNAGTSTLKFTGDGVNSITNNFGTSKTYYNVWIDVASPAINQVFTMTATTACTFNEFKITANTIETAYLTVKFQATCTYTATTWIMTSTSCSKIIYLESTNSGSATTLSDSAGTNTCSFLHLKDIAVTGGATWSAVSCNQVSGNSGWTASGAACVYDRYWVGGSADWDNTAGSKWSETSGGAGGASIPTPLYNVYFNASSGSVSVRPQGSVYCKNLICTGFTGTLSDVSVFNQAQVRVFGNTITLGAGMTCNSTNWPILLDVTNSDNCTITTNGKRLPPIQNNGSNVNYGPVFADAITACTGICSPYGLHNFGSFNHSIGCFATFSGTITLGTGTLTITDAVLNAGFPQWFPSGGSVFGIGYVTDSGIIEGTSTIKFTDTSSTTLTTYWSYYGTSTTNARWYNIWFSRGSSTGINRILTHLQCNELKDTGTAKHNLELTSTYTVTYTTLTVSGASCAARIVLKAVTPASAAILSKTSGTTSISYVEAKDITSNGGLTSFTIGTSYIDGGGNTGITFSGSICPSSNIKVFNGLAYASTKTVEGLAIASVKTKLGLA